MRLTNIELTNFRSFRGTTVSCAASRVVVAGRNGVGKTTVADAIRWVLIGSCRGTDARGAGAEHLIPQGESVADVSIGLDGIGRVTRTYSQRAAAPSQWKASPVQARPNTKGS